MILEGLRNIPSSGDCTWVANLGDYTRPHHAASISKKIHTLAVVDDRFKRIAGWKLFEAMECIGIPKRRVLLSDTSG